MVSSVLTQLNGQKRPPLTILGVARLFFYILVVFSYGLIANLVFLLSALVLPFNAGLAYEVNSKVAFWLWTYMQYVFEDLHGGKIVFSGDELPMNESAIAISNHVSYSDYYFIQAAAKRHGMLPYQRYFCKKELEYMLPVFGLSLRLMGMIMVKRDWASDSKAADEAFRRVKENNSPLWLVSYLEGTRVSDKKIAESQAFAKKRDLPILNNLLLPRTRGFVASVKALRGSHIKHVYDFTLAYTGPNGRFQDSSDLAAIHSCTDVSKYYSYRCHVRRYAIADLPTDDKKLAKWVEGVWAEKDAILQGFRDA